MDHIGWVKQEPSNMLASINFFRLLMSYKGNPVIHYAEEHDIDCLLVCVFEIVEFIVYTYNRLNH